MMMFLKCARIIALVSGLCWVASIFVLGYLDNTYVTYPRTPDLSTDRTVSYDVKTIVVYITPKQKHVVLFVRKAAFMSLVMLFSITVLTWGRALSPNWPPWRVD
jgi:hypothetical protein